MNNGIVLTPNVSTTDYSTYQVTLDAEVQGSSSTVPTYSWDLTNAADASGATGTATYELKFTWATFTTGTDTNTVKLTVTAGGNATNESITFLVQGTNSPGYSATQPTTTSTWSNVLPPDAVTANQAMGGNGPYYSVGLTDGELQTTHAMPAYNPNVPANSLIYVSTAGDARPIFVAHYQLPAGVTVPTSITAQLTFNGSAGSTYTFTTSSGVTFFYPGDTFNLALNANATSLGTGRYSYSFQVVDSNASPMTTTYSGSADIVNYKSNAFGAGWNLSGLERIYSVTGGVILDLGEGQSLWFANGASPGSYTTPAGDFSTLSKNTMTNVYTRTMPDGTQINFNSSGYQTSVVDRNGNTTSYNYNGSNALTSISDLNSQLTTFAYSGSNVTSIQDPANRLTTLAYNGSGELTSIKDANGALWTYSYDGNMNMSTLADPNNHTTTFGYLHNRIDIVTRADGTAENYTPLQTQGLPSSAPITQDTPPLVPQAPSVFKNADSNTTDYYADWLGFGAQTTSADPLNNTDLTHVNANGLAWLSADGLANPSRDFFDTSGNTTKMVEANNAVFTYTYNGDAEVTKEVDPNGNTVTSSYDTHGNLTQTQDALGNLTTYTYTSIGLVSTVKDALGHVVTNAYDTSQRITSTTDADGGVTTFQYDSAGNRTTVIDARGDRTTYSFDSLGRTTQTTDGIGDITTTLFDSAGNVTTTIDARGDRTTFSFDALNRQTKTIDAAGDVVTTLYDSNGNVTASYDGRGDETTFAYDSSGRQTSETDALSHVSTTMYDGAGNVTSTIDARGDRTTFLYDSLNRRTTTEDAQLNLSTVAYDLAGNMTASTDQLNHTVTHMFDQSNRETAVKDALGALSTTMYDSAGRVTETIDKLGDITTYMFDGAGRQTAIKDALGDLSTTAYDLAGNTSYTIDARGDRVTYSYDGDNRATAASDGMNQTTTTLFDGAGNVTTTIDPAGFRVTYAYDSLNRRTSSEDPGTGVVTTVFDKAGNVTNTIDAMGDKTTYSFDALNRQTGVTDPRGGVVTTAFDAVGNTTNIIEQDSNKTTFVFDSLNRETQQIDPLGYASSTAYDGAGRKTSATDRIGSVVSYSYDASNRETGETWKQSGSTVNVLTFTYNAMDELTAANYAGTYTLGYDKLNRMSSVQEPFGQTLTFSFDSVGNRTTTQDSQGGTLTAVYNADNLLTSKQFHDTNSDQLRIDLTYTSRNQVGTETRYSDDAGTNLVGTTSFTYDSTDRPTNIQHENATPSVIANYTYTYDLASRLSTETDNGTNITYSYDGDSELTDAGGTVYGYDLAGNRTMTGYSTGTGNELLNDGTWTYTYDHDGQMTEKSMGASATTWFYSYNNAGQMTSAIEDSQPTGGTLLAQATFVYDAMGNRVEQDEYTQSSGLTTVTRFAYDGQNVWADLNGSNQLQTRRVFLNGVDQVFARMDSSGNAAWYLGDHMGSIRVVMNSADTTTDVIGYDAFGNVTNESSSTFGDRYHWSGREFDALTGLQFNRNRYYSAPIGRWLTRDPLGFSARDPNLYRYAGNNPANLTDPSGERTSHAPPPDVTIKADWALFGPGTEGTSALGNVSLNPNPHPLPPAAFQSSTVLQVHLAWTGRRRSIDATFTVDYSLFDNYWPLPAGEYDIWFHGAMNITDDGNQGLSHEQDSTLTPPGLKCVGPLVETQEIEAIIIVAPFSETKALIVSYVGHATINGRPLLGGLMITLYSSVWFDDCEYYP
jgi:RHS repeat-associated protein